MTFFVREPLWRHVLGEYLRRLRHRRGKTLGDVARRAGVSPQYLSEIERGVKEPSSEIIAAVAGALDVTLVDLTVGIAADLAGVRSTELSGVRSDAPARTPAAVGPQVLALAA